MIVPKQQLAGILDGTITQTIQPPNQLAPTGTHRMRRKGGPYLCHVEILQAELIDLETVTDQTARRQGFPDANAYRDEWVRAHGGSWTLSHGWQITFRLAPEPDKVHLLANQNGLRAPEQYTSSTLGALPDEPESIDPNHLNPGWTRIAERRRQRDMLEVDAAYRTLRVEEKLQRARQLADEKGISITGPLAEAERHLDRALRRLDAA